MSVRARYRRRNRRHAADRLEAPEPFYIDRNLVPIVLIPDPGFNWPAEAYANSFGYNLAEGRHPCLPGMNWRSGPRGFDISPEDWSYRTIIVAQPCLVLSRFGLMPGDDELWDRFRKECELLAGRPPRVEYDSLCFDRP